MSAAEAWDDLGEFAEAIEWDVERMLQDDDADTGEIVSEDEQPR